MIETHPNIEVDARHRVAVRESRQIPDLRHAVRDPDQADSTLAGDVEKRGVLLWDVLLCLAIVVQKQFACQRNWCAETPPTRLQLAEDQPQLTKK